MPERFSPAQPNYLRFVSTPTIDIEPKITAIPLYQNDGYSLAERKGFEPLRRY